MVKKVNRENNVLIGSKYYGNKELYLDNISLIPKVQSLYIPSINTFNQHCIETNLKNAILKVKTMNITFN